MNALFGEGYDFAYIHLEASDEMAHQGSVEKKLKAIENVDRKVVGPLVEKLEASGEDFRLMVLPDHPTPIRLRTHTSDSVPYMLYDSRKRQDHGWVYHEEEARRTGIYVPEGHRLIERLFA